MVLFWLPFYHRCRFLFLNRCHTVLILTALSNVSPLPRLCSGSCFLVPARMITATSAWFPRHAPALPSPTHPSSRSQRPVSKMQLPRVAPSALRIRSCLLCISALTAFLSNAGALLCSSRPRQTRFPLPSPSHLVLSALPWLILFSQQVDLPGSHPPPLSRLWAPMYSGPRYPYPLCFSPVPLTTPQLQEDQDCVPSITATLPSTQDRRLF